MKRIALRIALPACLLACTAPTFAQRPPRYIEPTPYTFDDHPGWQSMFDGKTLQGWEGQIDAWHVEDGAITATDHGNSPSIYLFWKGKDGGDLKDFEFKTEIRLEGEKANSGVQFRAQLLGKTEKPNSQWESFGYQADMDFANVQTGALIECCAGPRRGPSPRPFRASMGLALRTAPEASGTPSLIGRIGDPGALTASIHTGGWNQLHVIARGHTLFYLMNGVLMSTVQDDDPARFIAHGRLAIQLEGSGDRKVSYRNMWLKTYP
ncbi:3-keto-disaccharide hydrolase [Novosphingobium rosa]|uniref:3-keto-disaccharide hydrolase n=1 Tax=Novosphingobium rosa TaxID=76978 RepID=UPI0008354C56|nr:DUF1080 domain-containing protein [Novosphingobium rosa]